MRLLMTSLAVALVGAAAFQQTSLAGDVVVVRVPGGVRGPAPRQVPPPPPGELLPPPVEHGSPPPVPLVPLPSASVPPVVGRPPVMVVAKGISLTEFACTFKPGPAGGKYEVVFQHPCTCCPVKVCFHLPCGCPKRIVARKSEVVIRYGLCKAVVLRFNRDGTVSVRD